MLRRRGTPVLRDEADDRVAALPPAGQRGHREGRVVGQHRDHGIHVAALPRTYVSPDGFADAVLAEGAQRGLLALGGSRSATALRARWRALFTEASLVSRASAASRAEKPEHLAQDERRPLVRRQVLEGGDEGELDALADLVAGLRRRVGLLRRELIVRIGLEPDGLAHGRTRALPRAGRRPVVRREDALRALRDHVQADVRGDLVEPRPDRAVPPESGQAAPGANERVLERVLRVVDRTDMR